MSIEIEFDSSWKDDFLHRIENDGPWGNWELFKLAIGVEKHLVIPDFKVYWHQVIYPI